MASNFVVLARLMKPHGVDGGIRADYYADSAELLNNPLLIRAGGKAPRPIKIKEWSVWRGQLILFLEGCDDRSHAELLRGQELVMDASLLPEEDAPYLDELCGMAIFLENGTRVGVLEEASFPAEQEIWTIRADDGHEILFPAVPEFVHSLDVEAGRIVISPPDGLLELYADSSSAAERDDGWEEDEEK